MQLCVVHLVVAALHVEEALGPGLSRAEQAAMKVLYLVATEKRPNRANPTGRINAWKKILNTLTIHYGERIQAAS